MLCFFILEELVPENHAEETQSGDRAKGITTEDHEAEIARKNQIKEIEEGSQLEDFTKGNQTEEMVTEDQMEKTLEDQIGPNVSTDQPEDMAPENQAEVNRPEDETEEMAAEYPIDEEPVWNSEDQRMVEAELREEAKKPVDERTYTWRLIVGKSLGRQIGSRAPAPRVGGEDHCYSRAVDRSAASTAVNVDNVRKADVIENLGIVMRSMTLTSTAAPRPYTVDQMTTTHKPVTENSEIMLEAPVVVDPTSCSDKRDAVCDRLMMDGAGASNEVAAPQPATVEEQNTSEPTRTQSPLRLSEPDSEDTSQRPSHGLPTHRSMTEILRIMRQNVEHLTTEPALPKDDILKERRFISNQQLPYSTAGHPFSVVSYNIMAELEKDETRQAEEARTAGHSRGRGRGCGRAGRAAIPSELLPRNYDERIIFELNFLQPDVFCFQSIAHWHWGKLEKMLNK